jgi:hypothetical protein
MDIDIDFADRSEVIDRLILRVAALEPGKKHNTGVYATEIPHDPITNISTINYKEADARGYFKLDFLNVGVYDHVKDNEHLDKLVSQEPMWELLEHQEFSDQLFHLNGHSEILQTMKPKSLEQLAAVLAIIRPAKRHLIGKDWDTVMSDVWIKPEGNEYFFKKSHSFSYAMLVIVHMNVLCEQLSSSASEPTE